jgi:hypothetical protein
LLSGFQGDLPGLAGLLGFPYPTAKDGCRHCVFQGVYSHEHHAVYFSGWTNEQMGVSRPRHDGGASAFSSLEAVYAEEFGSDISLNLARDSISDPMHLVANLIVRFLAGLKKFSYVTKKQWGEIDSAMAEWTKPTGWKSPTFSKPSKLSTWGSVAKIRWLMECSGSFFFSFWNLEFGIWNLEFGIWNLEFGI